jgi:hypothetical protein
MTDGTFVPNIESGDADRGMVIQILLQIGEIELERVGARE